MFCALLRKKPVDWIELLQLGRVGVGEGGGVGVAGEQGGRDQVDAHVGALGRQDGGDEQLEGRRRSRARSGRRGRGGPAPATRRRARDRVAQGFSCHYW